ncbi:MAG: phosphatidylcholine/phosphatidylserine synthase [Cyclobacteriaceae bacterium]
MNNIIKHIPNLITLCNLFCGCIAITLAISGDVLSSFLFILLGAFFDIWDGFVARLLKIASPLGKELDSFSDLTTFGLAPAFLIFYSCFSNEWYGYLLFIIPATAALRLAKYNITEHPEGPSFFDGVPSPAAGITLASIPYGYQHYSLINNPIYQWILLGIIIVISLSMLTTWKYPKLNIKNRWQVAFLIISLILLYLLGTQIILPIFILYLLIPLFNIK